MELSILKGTKEYLLQEAVARESIKEILIKTFQRYGFDPLETPLLSRYELLAAKYAGGAEILKETYKLTDQGKRNLALRYDLTVPFAQMIGRNSQLKMPYKRYEIGKVFRDGPIKLGRMREFTQCDVDVVGNKSLGAEAEFFAMTKEIFESLNLDISLEVNNIKLLKGILEQCGIKKEKTNAAIMCLDKLKKIGEKEVEKELQEVGVSKSSCTKAFQLLNLKGTYEQKIKFLEKEIKDDLAKQGLQEIKELFSWCKEYNLKNIMLLPSLARGLSYYTGIIFEGYVLDGSFPSSLCAGGRYDAMIGGFLETKREFPAVGMTFGLEPIYEVLKLKKGFPKKSVTQIYVIPIGTTKQSIAITQRLRQMGIATDIDKEEKGITKNLNYANRLGIPYVLLVGEDELKQKKVK